VAIIHQTGGGGGEGLTAGSRALELFTDREEPILRFLAALNDDPPPGKVLFFTGDGGNGKSLLLRCLGRHYCRRLHDPENWAWVRSRPAEEALAQVREAEDADAVPWALLDFGMQPRGDDRPQEGFAGLLMLNRMLTAHGLRFPVFEFSCVWYLYKTDRLTDEKLRELFPSEVMDFITEIAGTISQTSWAYLANSILRIFDSQMSAHVTLYQYTRGLKAAQIEAIQRMDPEGELIDQLPRLWAEDLNAAMALADAPDRVVLFFDTHEAFWGSERGLSEDLYFQYDEWLRSLLAHLELANGIVAVLAGRERPRWSQATLYPIPDDCLEAIAVGHFAERDAQRYLTRAGVRDAALRRTLIARARVRRNEVHPFFLGLCADLVETAAARGTMLGSADFPRVANQQDRGRALVQRLLRYVDQEVSVAVRALCACRSFDREIYFRLGQAVGFTATEGSFGVLCRFSFVWEAHRRGEGWYRIHDLLRRLVREENDPIARRADGVLEALYQARAHAGDAGAVAEAAYHANQLEPARGVERWVSGFEDALARRDYDVCRALIEVWTDLRIDSDFARGRVLDAQGDYFAATAEPEEAEESFQGAIAEFDQTLAAAPGDVAALLNRGNSLLGLGDLQASHTQDDAARASYAAAIASFEKALELTPDDPAAHNNLGNGWQRLGRLQAAREQAAEALESCGRAEWGYRAAERRAPHDPAVRDNLGSALLGTGEALASLGRHEEALAAYRRAIEAYGEGTSGHAQGNALSRQGDLQERMGRYDDAAESYRAAIEAFESALKRMPGDLAARNNLGNALQGLAEMQASIGRTGEACASYARAIEAYAETLRRAPEYAAAYPNQGLALHGLAKLLADGGDAAAAVETYGKAAAACQEALYRAPNDFVALHGKGRALHAQADLQVALHHPEAAVRGLKKAVAAYDKAIRRAPVHPAANRAKGDALQTVAELLLQAGKPQDARRCWSRAVAAYGRALRGAPDDLGLWGAKANAIEDLADLFTSLGRAKDSLAHRRRAAHAYAEGVKRAPRDPGLLSCRGSALARAGETLDALQRDAEAEKMFEQANSAFDAALAAGPETDALRNRRGFVLVGLAHVQAELGRHDQAADTLARAVAEFTRSLELDPEKEPIRELRDQLAATLGE